MDSGADNRADEVITTMMAAAMGGAIVPAVVQWPIFASAKGTGVVGIGHCYGVRLTKDEAWKLIVQFIRAAGLTFAGLYVGSQILSLILTSTGIGYVGAVAMDATIAGAIAYAVGATAKAYFQEERNVVSMFQRSRCTICMNCSKCSTRLIKYTSVAGATITVIQVKQHMIQIGHFITQNGMPGETRLFQSQEC